MSKYIPLIWKGTKWAVQLGCFAHLFNQHVAELTWCIGPSMLPNFELSGIVVVDHLYKHYSELKIGDVITCTSPAVPGRVVMKRIIGMPGDNVCVDPTVSDRKYISVPKGHIWLGGDNLSNSTDSRSYGPVSMGLIKGRVFAKVWPEPELLKNNLTLIA
ncbi:hypothetical protein G6F57_007616 [Rhizopus arrhizus]|uniref:Peptidase S26 domain-containing protein n=1 Tax=Rhizopus oryzae TaxID=64495 RepID=A0A9P6XG16_RHIOR|nr:hypothetical protein G6F23_003020 [Rhizopus arrhizus]KAG1420995.1 hypothetical protein G6F58_003944 [Rhizopus delemar]KAG0761728.1 hypothetical protein G6F24_007344 [Rhizopus arrhizus]KAG0791472.1 hypothetical protein G6F21_005061 [Rhizopus arrhizus]KAG0801220.1 hypothetical protein G6F22_001462 [Rhizopus arrhizus]